MGQEFRSKRSGATTRITSRLGEVLLGKTRAARDSVRALISVNLSFVKSFLCHVV
jgi:hypothetical protein